MSTTGPTAVPDAAAGDTPHTAFEPPFDAVPNADVRIDPLRRICHLDRPVTADVLRDVHPLGLTDRGHRVLHVHHAVPLGTDAELDVHLARLLRECIAVGLDVLWAAAASPGWSWTRLRHLPPPHTGCDDWRRQFAFGLCYYRMGPDFIAIRDTRAGPGEGARYVLDEPEAVSAWASLEGVLDLTRATPADLHLVALLAEEDLVLVADNWATVLPFRMRCWPVPEFEV